MPGKAFNQAISRLPTPIKARLEKVPDSVKETACEVRLRSGRPISVTIKGIPHFLMENGRVSSLMNSGCKPVSSDELAECLRSLCDYSVHARQKEINAGFIPLPGGHRAGISGTAVGSGYEIENVRDINGINIRIARSLSGSAGTVADMFRKSMGSVILAGPPGSGKTTMLRETVRLLSGGVGGAHRNVAVVDERFEIGGEVDGEAQFDLGCCTDILGGYPKAAGVISALRALSPHIIAFDEVGDSRECAAVSEGLSSGVRFIITMHAGSREEIFKRPVSRKLLETGAFDTVILLSGDDSPGRIKEVIKPYDDYKNSGSVYGFSELRIGGD